MKDVEVNGLINAKQTVNNILSGVWSEMQLYSFNDGMMYTLASNATPLTSLRIIDIPTTPLQTYTFKFIIKPDVKSTPFYLKTTSIRISINNASVPLFGLINVVLPSSYTCLVQEITIMNKSTTTTPSFVAFTNVLGYDAPAPKNVLIAGGSGTNTIALSEDNGLSWMLPNNQPFTSRGYKCAFDGNRVVMGGNSNIAYSDYYGKTWVSTGFTSLEFVYQIRYFAEKKMWFAVGISSSIASSLDGINWTLSNQIFNGNRCYDIVYNGNVYIASGWGDFPTATSSDGFSWTFNTTLAFQTSTRKYSFGIYYDKPHNQFILMGTGFNTNSNIATSQDGITWVENGYIPMDIRAIAYNDLDAYVAVGSNTNSPDPGLYYYWSNDLITWNAPVNNLLGSVIVWDVFWDGTNFIVGSTTSSGTNIIYSTDGKNWNPSNNSKFSSATYGFSQISY